MKIRVIVIFTVLFVGSDLYAQKVHSGQLPTFNLFSNPDYTVTAIKFDEELKFKYIISKKGNDPKEFTVETNTLDNFQGKFEEIIKEFDPTQKGIKSEARRIFYMFIAASKLLGDLNTGPLAGELILRRKVVIHKSIERAKWIQLKGEARCLLRDATLFARNKDKKLYAYVNKNADQNDQSDAMNNGNEKGTNTDQNDQSDAMNNGNEKGTNTDQNDQSEAMNNGNERGTTTNRNRKNNDDGDRKKYLQCEIKKEPLWTGELKEKKAENRIFDFLVTLDREYSGEKIVSELKKDMKPLREIVNTNDLLSAKQKEIKKKQQNIYAFEDNITTNQGRLIELKNKYEKICIEIYDHVPDIQEIMKDLNNKVSKLIELQRIVDLSEIDNSNFTTLKTDTLEHIDKSELHNILSMIEQETIKIDEGHEQETQAAIKKIRENYENGILDDSTKIYIISNLKKIVARKVSDLELQRINIAKLKKEIEIRDVVIKLHDNIAKIEIVILRERALIRADDKKLELLVKDKNELLSKKARQIIAFNESLPELKHKLNQKTKNLPSFSFLIDQVQIEFKDGFIENLKVVGKKEALFNLGLPDSIDFEDDIEIKFDNYYPFGFSRKKDFEDLIRGDWPRVFASKRNPAKRGGNKFYLSTSEFFDNYKHDLVGDRRDYSPKNGVIDLQLEDGKKYLKEELFKLERKKLFEAKVFSDFFGFDRENENGIIQTEVSRQVNVRTRRSTLNLRRYKLIFSNWGYASYVIPSINISKIEENNRYLNINYKDEFVNNQYSPTKFVSTLDLRSYENFSAGFDVNGLLLDFPTFKSTLLIDAGIRFGTVSVTDTLRVFENQQIMKTKPDNSTLSTTRLMPLKITWKLQADERYGFDINWSINRLFLRDNEITQVGNKSSFLNGTLDPGKNDNCMDCTYYRFEFNTQINNNDNGKLFLRYRYFWQKDFWNTGFHQAQVGYSFFINGALRDDEAKKD